MKFVWAMPANNNNMIIYLGHILLFFQFFCQSILSATAFVTNTDRNWLLLSSKSTNNNKKTNNCNNRRLYSSVNPNDLETPEERAKRMALVRQLQKSFYQDSQGVEYKKSEKGGILENVPLWRVQWTELPGYNNILNCHVPHYTNMFMKIINGPKPWYFGHFYLPGGSENLDNPDYFFNNKKNNDNDNTSLATTTGVLMQVCDYEQLEQDGRLVLVVQALERIEIVHATQHLPHAIATVQIIPDQELIEAQLPIAKNIINMQQNSNVIDTCNDTDDMILPWIVAQSAAVAEAMHWQPFEFRPVTMVDYEQGQGVSPLINFDTNSLPKTKLNSSAVVENYLNQQVQKEQEIEKEESVDQFREIIEKNLLKYRQGTTTTTAATTTKDPTLPELATTIDLECQVWIALDLMLQLLSKINPNPKTRIPIPTQILGLLPQDQNYNWPKNFQLAKQAKMLQDSDNDVLVGTMSKSPFVIVDTVSHHRDQKYPNLRRAQRFSFAVWMLLDSLLAGYNPAARNRQAVLELPSTFDRLAAAKRGLDTINFTLQNTINQQS